MAVVVLRRKKENVPDGGQLLIYLFTLCSGYVFNILKDLYLLLEELKKCHYLLLNRSNTLRSLYYKYV